MEVDHGGGARSPDVAIFIASKLTLLMLAHVSSLPVGFNTREKFTIYFFATLYFPDS